MWSLWLRGNLLGTLTRNGADQPALLCHFEPTAAFDEVRIYFELQALHIDTEDLDGLELIQLRIEALGLELRSDFDGALMDITTLIIDGNSAEFIPIQSQDGPHA